MQVAERRVDQRHELGQRRDDRTDELATQHVERRQGRKSVDLVARQRLAFEDPSAQRQHVGLLGLRRERLRHGRGIAAGLDEGDRRRTFEHDEQCVGAGLLGRPASQRVLDDAKPCSVLEQIVAQRLELLVREPAVVGDDQRVRFSQVRGELGHDSFLVGFQHVMSS